MHDYGVAVRLEDAETGKVITSVVATRDAAGKVTKISRQLFGVSGEGLKLKANHKYRVVGEYDNPDQRDQGQGRDGPHGRPVRARRHEQVAARSIPSDPDYQRDLASLQVPARRGQGMTMDHGRRTTAEGRMQMDQAGTRWTMARWTSTREPSEPRGRDRYGGSRATRLRRPHP